MTACTKQNGFTFVTVQASMQSCISLPRHCSPIRPIRCNVIVSLSLCAAELQISYLMIRKWLLGVLVMVAVNNTVNTHAILSHTKYSVPVSYYKL